MSAVGPVSRDRIDEGSAAIFLHRVRLRMALRSQLIRRRHRVGAAAATGQDLSRCKVGSHNLSKKQMQILRARIMLPVDCRLRLRQFLQDLRHRRSIHLLLQVQLENFRSAWHAPKRFRQRKSWRQVHQNHRLVPRLHTFRNRLHRICLLRLDRQLTFNVTEFCRI